jgi:long-chain acyl-CoA synthetase
VTNRAPLDHDRLTTLWDVIAYHAEQAPQSTALEFEGRITSYSALVEEALAVRRLLIASGVRPGDRVVYLGKNSDLYFVLLFGIAATGAVLVPLNWRLAPDEWDYIVEDAGAVLLFCDAHFADAATGLAARFVLPPPIRLDSLDLPVDDAAEAPGVDTDPDAVLLQIYTSGTTGRPKGAMLTHRNVIALRAPGYRAGLHWFPGSSDTSLVVLPVAHIAGTAYATFGIYGGGRVVITREFDPGETLALLESAGVTHMLLAPAALRLLVEHPAASTARLPKFRYLTYGASPIPEALQRQSIAMLSCDFVQMYGMTETAGGVVVLTPEDHKIGDSARLQSAGRAMPGAEVRIVDSEGATLPPGEIGEIALRSAAVMKGYWRRPEATAETISVDGWLRTGDLGRIDAEGYVYVLDRAKDMIISGGENVYPAEVENAIFGHPDVAEVAVIGVPSKAWGEEVLAIVVARAGRDPDAASIIAWARQRIAAFKAPKSVRFVDSLPRNAGGKVLRRTLREPYWQDSSRRVG